MSEFIKKTDIVKNSGSHYHVFTNIKKRTNQQEFSIAL
jgi:hypothetical protein